jgi:hypothetical protein
MKNKTKMDVLAKYIDGNAKNKKTRLTNNVNVIDEEVQSSSSS